MLELPGEGKHGLTFISMHHKRINMPDQNHFQGKRHCHANQILFFVMHFNIDIFL